MTILHVAPNFQKKKKKNWDSKILICENTLITTERQEIQTIYLKKKKQKTKKKQKQKKQNKKQTNKQKTKKKKQKKKNISAYIFFDIIEYV